MSNFAYIGAFTYKGADGINICKFNEENGSLEYIKTVCPGINASHILINNNLLYATDEQSGNPEMGGTGGGRVFVFEINHETGDLQEIQKVHTYGANPSHISFDTQKKYAIVPHFAIGPSVTKIKKDKFGEYHPEVIYNDTTICLFRLNENGTLGKLCDASVLEPKDGIPVHCSMVHSTFQSSIEDIYACCDLGVDQIRLFKIDYENEVLIMLQSGECRPGSGPRHGVYHTKLPYIYVNYEQNGVVSTFKQGKDTIEHIEDIDIMPAGEELQRRYNQSELLLSADGKFLYDFFRGLGLAYTFKVDLETGKLKLLQVIDVGVKVPRGATFTPDNRYIIIACNESGRTKTLAIDNDGLLINTNIECEMPHPASIAFYMDL